MNSKPRMISPAKSGRSRPAPPDSHPPKVSHPRRARTASGIGEGSGAAECSRFAAHGGPNGRAAAQPYQGTAEGQPGSAYCMLSTAYRRFQPGELVACAERQFAVNSGYWVEAGEILVVLARNDEKREVALMPLHLDVTVVLPMSALRRPHDGTWSEAHGCGGATKKVRGSRFGVPGYGPEPPTENREPRTQNGNGEGE